MKARVTETGEIIEVEQRYACGQTWWHGSDGKQYISHEQIKLLDEWQCEECGEFKLSDELDGSGICKECAEKKEKAKWEPIRVQATIAVIQGMYSRDSDLSPRLAAIAAVRQADALIEELKKQK